MLLTENRLCAHSSKLGTNSGISTNPQHAINKPYSNKEDRIFAKEQVLRVSFRFCNFLMRDFICFLFAFANNFSVSPGPGSVLKVFLPW